MKNYYDILGVSKNATQDEIKKAFREMSKKYHPDRPSGDEAKFKEINEAYSVLGDETKRKEYDNPFGSSSNSSRWNGFGGGGGFASGNWSWGDGFFNRYQEATDIEITVYVNLDEGHQGCKKVVDVRGKKLSVDIPKGIRTGQKLRIREHGNPGRSIEGNITYGDLIVTVNVVSNDKVWLNGDGSMEVVCTLDWIDAILGMETTLHILGKDVNFKVPKFTQNGGFTILAGQGYHMFKSDSCGILKVNYIVNMPTKLTDEQIKLLEKIKESM